MAGGTRNSKIFLGSESMFNLELAIETWKSSLRSHGSMTMENIAELETHLRAQMIDLQKLGLSEQESFGIATGRLGQTSELNYAYSKVNGSTIWRSRVYWMIAGSLVYCVAARLIHATASITSTVISRMGAGPMATSSTIVIALGWTALLYLLYKQSTKAFAGPNRVSNRWVLTAAVTLLFSCIFGLGANVVNQEWGFE